MYRQIFSLAILGFVTVFFFQSCATKGYRTAMEAGNGFEAQQQYIKAYEIYQTALKEKPDDKIAQAKIKDLGKIIANDFTAKGNVSFGNGQFQNAKQAYENALKYQADYQPALNALVNLEKALKDIQNKYAEAEKLRDNNEWIQAVFVLKEIQNRYKDDQQLSTRINDLVSDGYAYYRQRGMISQKQSLYIESLDQFNNARQLKVTEEIEQDIAGAKNYIQADAYYEKALMHHKQNKLEAAVNSLIDARKIVNDHEKANLLYLDLLDTWSSRLMMEGRRLLERKDFRNAYEIFNKLYAQNPEFPEAESYYKQTKNILLKMNYVLLTDALKKNNFLSAIRSADDIKQIEPKGFLYSSEMAAGIPLTAFNMFYQRGLHYLNTGDYGKAILAFQSAEAQLGETVSTLDGIDEAKRKIIDTNRLKIAFWNFYQKNGEPGISSHAAAALKKSLKKAEKISPLKNIQLEYDIISDDEMSLRADQKNIDWGLIQSKACNVLLTGNIKSFRIDSSEKSDWKTRVYKKKQIIDNKEYLSLVIKLAKLNNARMNKIPETEIDGQVYAKKDYAKEIEHIETILPGISPKVEAEVEEKSSYQVEKHMLTAFMKIDVNILYQNGSLMWPAMSYQDEFKLEDLVISPDLQSSVPEERAGDPLVLPSEYEFMKMALNHIIETKIAPDVYGKLDNYGMRFYFTANELLPMEKNISKASNDHFKSAIEEYYKFLMCYKDKGAADNKPEKVTDFLNSLISQRWIMR